MDSTDARPVPRKNTAYRVVFPIYDSTGALVSGAAGLDSEVSIDQGTAADCTNEATEIATSTGLYYLDLTATEMNADCVAVVVKTSTTDARATVIILYPEEAGDIRADAVQISGDSTAADNLEAAADGTGYNLGAGSIVAASVTGHVGGNVTGSIGSLATQAKADVNAEVDTAISDAALATAANLATVAGYVDTEVAAIKAKTDNLPASPAASGDVPSAATVASAVRTELTTELAHLDADVSSRLATSGYTAPPASDITAIKAVTDLLPDAGALTSLATQASVDAIDTTTDALAVTLATVDTDVEAIKTSTDALPASPAATGDIPAASAISDAVWDEVASGHTTAGSFGNKLRVHQLAVLVAVIGTGSTTTAVTLSTVEGASPSSTDDFYTGAVLVLTSGTLAGQRTSITDYDGATTTATVVALTSAPATGVTGVIV